MTGAELISNEYNRHFQSGERSPELDPAHANGEMMIAAACYLLHETGNVYFHPAGGLPPMAWPWESKWWKPAQGDRVQDLVKAGAFIAAEIDRIQKLKPAPIYLTGRIDGIIYPAVDDSSCDNSIPRGDYVK